MIKGSSEGVEKSCTYIGLPRLRIKGICFYERFAIWNRARAEASDMAAYTRRMAYGMEKNALHRDGDHATVFGSDEVGFCRAGDCI